MITDTKIILIRKILIRKILIRIYQIYKTLSILRERVLYLTLNNNLT
jgi:hypothetical protein